MIMRQDVASDRKERFGGKRYGAVENTALIERFMQIGVLARQ